MGNTCLKVRICLGIGLQPPKTFLCHLPIFPYEKISKLGHIFILGGGQKLIVYDSLGKLLQENP